MLNQIQKVCQFIPSVIGLPIEKAAATAITPFHEIRLRIGQAPSITSFGKNYFITKQGELTTLPATDLIVTKSILQETFMLACRHSVYAYDKELKNGFITLPGGFRMGLAGRIVYENNMINTIRDISSISIRIASEQKGCASELLAHLAPSTQVHSCAIISPPGGGKTTILRDIARGLSVRGFRVCIIDERREIAACHDGVSPYDLGPLCDVLDGCDKVDGMMWALRCLSPSVIIMDELGQDEESRMVLQGISGGVATIFSLHAATLSQAFCRTPLRMLIEKKEPELLVMLGQAQHPGTISHIYNLTRKEDASLVKDLWNSSA